MKRLLTCFRLHVLLLILATGSTSVLAQPFSRHSEEPLDTAVVSRITDEGTNRSQVMDLVAALTEGHGPRLTGSPGHEKAAEWARAKLGSWGLASWSDAWGPFGRGWTLKRYHTTVTAPRAIPLVSFPKAWSPGTGGLVRGEVVYINVHSDSALDTYRGKLKGAFVLLGEPRAVQPQFKPRAERETDQSLLTLSNADFPSRQRGRRRADLTDEQRAERKRVDLLTYRTWKMCEDEGAHAILTPSRSDGGNVFVMGANVPAHPDSPSTATYRAFERKAPRILPQIAVGAEHFNHLVRMLQRGMRVSMEMNLDVEFHKADSSYNIIAELPGTDLKDEVVMLGAHLDSWHGATGATDNATGVATCMEALRIITALDLKPRRTIRIGLWSGEEQGLFGSRAYVKKYLGERVTEDSVEIVKLLPAGKQLSIYINNDNGTGKIRGVYMQGNEGVRNIFRKWLKPFESGGAHTLTLSNTGSTDHVPFDMIGIPAFQFIQDDIEYFTLSWHSTMDLYERVIEEDLKQTAIIMASFIYHAAMRDEMMPRKKE